MKLINKMIFAMLCLSLIACSPSVKPKETFEQFIIAYKSQDQVAMNTLTTTPLVLYRTTEGDSGDIAKLSNRIYTMLLDFDYEIKEETIKSDSASLVVEIKTYDFEDVLKKGIDEVNESLNSKLEDEEDISTTDAYISAFKYIEDATKGHTTTIEVTLEKIDGKWLITNPKALENAIIENYNNSIKQIEFNPADDE